MRKMWTCAPFRLVTVSCIHLPFHGLCGLRSFGFSAFSRLFCFLSAFRRRRQETALRTVHPSGSFRAAGRIDGIVGLTRPCVSCVVLWRPFASFRRPSSTENERKTHEVSSSRFDFFCCRLLSSSCSLLLSCWTGLNGKDEKPTRTKERQMRLRFTWSWSLSVVCFRLLSALHPFLRFSKVRK